MEENTTNNMTEIAKETAAELVPEMAKAEKAAAIQAGQADKAAEANQPKPECPPGDNFGPKKSWGDNPVTKKFLALALALTVLVNAGVTAGILALTGKTHTNDRFGMHDKGRPGSEMGMEQKQDGKSRMAPPQAGQSDSSNNKGKTNGKTQDGKSKSQKDSSQSSQSGSDQTSQQEDDTKSQNQTSEDTNV